MKKTHIDIALEELRKKVRGVIEPTKDTTFHVSWSQIEDIVTTTLHSISKEAEERGAKRTHMLECVVQEMYAQMQESESTLLYDILSMAFYRDTGIWPPGKSAPSEIGQNPKGQYERWKEWNAKLTPQKHHD